MSSVVILGSKGNLGGQLLQVYPGATGWDREEVDATDFAAVRARLMGLGAAVEAVINCVAFNDVDGAEERREQAFLLNAELPGALAGMAREMGVPLVHFSTNYVFDGAAGEYAEDAAPAPLSVYGASKLEGERRIAEQGGQWYVARTAVIFGPKGESALSKKSFVDIMLDLAAKRSSIEVVSDEENNLTYAPDLAVAARALLEDAPPSGIYHLTNSGSASWYECAGEIFRVAGKDVKAVPVPAARFPRKATRPAKALLRNTKRPLLRPWQEALKEFLL
ncbi:MAG TPA: sugar nucleotide-binding protein [Bryobacteraceae bacterium]|nr:sugar nucleotide-binding protein [Bryobacteraceae bacterium]